MKPQIMYAAGFRAGLLMGAFLLGFNGRNADGIPNPDVISV